MTQATFCAWLTIVVWMLIMIDESNCQQSPEAKATAAILKLGGEVLPVSGVKVDEVTLSDLKVKDSELLDLAAFANLKILRLVFCDCLTGSFFRNMTDLAEMKAVRITDCKRINNEGLKCLAEVRSLKSVSIMSCEAIDGSGLRNLSGIAALTDLRLNCPKSLKSADYSEIRHLRSLIELEIVDATGNLDDKSVAGWNSLTNLTRLNLQGAIVSSSGVEVLAALPKLQRLTLQGCSEVSDLALNRIAASKVLRQLDLVGATSISDQGISNLAASTSIEKLDLTACRRLTDASLLALHKMKGLRELRLNTQTCEITTAGLSKLQKALPSLKIVDESRAR